MTSRFALTICLFLLLADSSTFAQSYRHLEQTHDLTTFESLPEWLNHAGWLKDQILVSAGLSPMPVKTDLNPVVSDLVEADGYLVQTITLETHPDFYLTGTLFLPPGEGPFPAILSAHGHWTEGRFENIERASIPGRALNFAKRGYAVFSYSMIGYNETKEFFPHRFDTPRYQLWGYSAMGLQLWNSIRALDYLSTRPEVDPNRIGMTGASGGGTQTFMLTAVDDRIKAAAPVNMVSAHFQGGCICENGPLLRHAANNVEIVALTAPRPLLMVSTSGDWTVNTPNTEFPAVQEIYTLFNAPDHVENAHFSYPHNYNKDTRESVYAWFDKWLGSGTNPSEEAQFHLPDMTTQNATLPGEPATKDALFASLKADAINQFSSQTPSSWNALAAFKETYGKALSHILQPATLPEVTLSLMHPEEQRTSTDAVLIIYEDNPASKAKAHAVAANYVTQGMTAALFTPTSANNAISPPDSIPYWTTYNPVHTQRQVHEIMAAAHQLNNHLDIREIDMAGLGTPGAITLLASSQLPFIRSAHADFAGIAYDTDDAFLKYANIPLIRRAGGFKTAAALMAPRRLTLSNLPNSNTRSWIRALYNELGAGDMLSFE